MAGEDLIKQAFELIADACNQIAELKGEQKKLAEKIAEIDKTQRQLAVTVANAFGEANKKVIDETDSITAVPSKPDDN